MIQARPPVPAERVHAELERVLAGRELRPADSLLGEVLEWLGRHLSPGQIGSAAEALLWVSIVPLAGLFVWLLVRALRRAGAGPQEAGEERAPGPRERVAQLLAEAQRAREAGDLRLALRLHLFALIVGLGERGDLRYHAAWTNRELLRRGRPEPAALALLEPLVAELEPKEFGREPVTEADVERLAQLAARVLGPARRAA